ncbi:hypothetical protein Ae201684_012034 [Aphanomyces euteiches]|uniref:Uncharacterized protein n=1 Tax=Aphanomyces euteiches TaxID=100861 RepID=A0A6G0WT62_9STRA|nr:hypothetical protein Ae201684_012034 [Aphanomyces euteiches]
MVDSLAEEIDGEGCSLFTAAAETFGRLMIIFNGFFLLCSSIFGGGFGAGVACFAAFFATVACSPRRPSSILAKLLRIDDFVYVSKCVLSVSSATSIACNAPSTVCACFVS